MQRYNKLLTSKLFVFFFFICYHRYYYNCLLNLDYREFEEINSLNLHECVTISLFIKIRYHHVLS